jgi:hypothetical protein
MHVLQRIRCKISTQYLLSFLQTVVDVTLKIADVNKLKHDKCSILCLYLKERRYLFIELYQKLKIEYKVKFSVCIFVAIILTWCLFICQVSSCPPLWEYAKVNNLRSREVTHIAMVSFRLHGIYTQLPIPSIYVLATSLHSTENFTLYSIFNFW